MRPDNNPETPTTPERVAALRAMPYDEYLSTPEWRRRRNRALMRASWHCEQPRCSSTVALQVHHRRYDHLGEERDGDLCVLCAAHHLGVHQKADRFVRLHWRVIRDVIHSGAFESYSDFAEAVKLRFHALHIWIDDPFSLNESLAIALRHVALDIPSHPIRVDVSTSPAHISEQEARDILAGLGLADVVRPMPRVRFVTAQTADRLKAMRAVVGEITRTMQRCEALETQLLEEDV
jgi:hypothetical protein